MSPATLTEKQEGCVANVSHWSRILILYIQHSRTTAMALSHSRTYEASSILISSFFLSKGKSVSTKYGGHKFCELDVKRSMGRNLIADWNGEAQKKMTWRSPNPEAPTLQFRCKVAFGGHISLGDDGTGEFKRAKRQLAGVRRIFWHFHALVQNYSSDTGSSARHCYFVHGY